MHLLWPRVAGRGVLPQRRLRAARDQGAAAVHRGDHLKPELFYKTKRYKELSNTDVSTPSPRGTASPAVEQKEQDSKEQGQERKEAGVEMASVPPPSQPTSSPAAAGAGAPDKSMAIIVHDDGGRPVPHSAFLGADGKGAASGTATGGSQGSLDDLSEKTGKPLKWGDWVLPASINRSRYHAFMIIYHHYQQSVYYQDVLQVLDAQHKKYEQYQVQHANNKHSLYSTHKKAAAAQPTGSSGNVALHVPPADAAALEEPEEQSRGWGPLGRKWYRSYNSSPWLQLSMNVSRQTVLTIRNTGLWRDTWLTSIVMGFFLGSLFYQVGYTYQEVRNRVGLFFFILSYLAFNAVMLVPVLAHQRAVYYNQLASGYYHGFAYYISHFVTQIPIVVVETLLLLLPVWGLANLQGPTGGREFWYAYLVIGFNSLISRVWMILLASVSPNEVYADVLNTVTNIIFTKLCGYFIAASNIVNGTHSASLCSMHPPCPLLTRTVASSHADPLCPLIAVWRGLRLVLGVHHLVLHVRVARVGQERHLAVHRRRLRGAGGHAGLHAVLRLQVRDVQPHAVRHAHHPVHLHHGAAGAVQQLRH